MYPKRSVYTQIVITTFVFSSCILAATLITFFVLRLFPLHNGGDSATTLRLVQSISALFIFIVPTLTVARWLSPHPLRSLSLSVPISLPMVGITLLLFTAMSPLVGWLEEINRAIVFPNSLAWLETMLQEKEKQAEITIELLLQGNRPIDYLMSFSILALLAGVGEELLFRGGLQNLLQHRIGNPHIAVWVVAIIFSAIHLQFYGFIPRLILGAVLGYLLVWSGSLWIPILAHTYNNAAFLALQLMSREGVINFDPETFRWSEHPLWLVASGVCVAGIGWIISRYSDKWAHTKRSTLPTAKGLAEEGDDRREK